MSATNASAQPPKPEVSVDDASSSPVPSFSSSPSSSSSTASETNTSVTCSILSNLERLIADGLTDDNDEQASETGSQTLLPMLVAGLEESMQLVAEMKDATTSTAATTQNATLSLMHRECVRDIASMMCGGDYPQWVEAQLMAQEEGDEEEEDEEDDEEREDTAHHHSILHRNEDADDEPARRDTAECDLGARHGDAPTSPPQQQRETNTTIVTTTTTSTTQPAVPAPMKTETRADEGQACNVAVKEEKEREEKSGPDMRALTECVAEQQHTKTWSFMMQQALEALQLSLPLQEKPREGGASSPTSVADTPVQQLARHLVSDAPLLWLRYLLVPMYAEWTQLRAHFSGLAQAQLRTAQAEHRTTPSATQLAGAETMRRLLCALCAAAHETALKNETVFADSMVSAVRALPTPPDDEAAQSLKKAATTNVSGAAALLAAQKRSKAQQMVKDVRRSQRRHVASLLCFSGTLARTAQSFTVIGSGGFTLVSVFAVRVMGHVRAAFAEWSRSRTAQEMSRDGPLRSVMSHQADVDGRDEAMPTCVDDAAVGGADRPAKRPRLDSDNNGNSHSQFVRESDGYKQSSTTSTSRGVAGGDEHNVRASAAPSPAAAASDAKTCLADSLAALRVTLAVSARQYATQLWHAWQLLFGFFGTDVYTDAALAQRLEEEAYAAAGVGHLSAAQQAQWRRLRHSSAVKQHTLSETHWLWCMCCLAQVRTSLLDDAIALHKVRDGSTAVVFRRVMMDALGIFFDAVRDSLVLYGQSLMASRAGGMPSANLIDAAALHHVLNNTLGVQPVFAHLLHDSCWWESEAEAAEVAKLRRVVGVYVARVRPYLLRAQAPEEVSWMGSIASASAGATTRGGSTINTSGGGAMASSGGEDNSEALTRQFRREWERHWRSRAAVMSDVLRGTSARMETVLAEVEAGGDGSAQLHGEAHQKRRREGGDEMGDVDGREGDADGHTDYAIQMKVFEEIISGDERREHRPVDRPKANSGTAASFSFSLPSPPPAPHSAQHPSNNSCSSHPLESVSANFSSYYDATCFFLLRPERQRAFTRAVEKLCSLVDESAVPADGAMTQLFAHTLRQDTRLWMLLAHGTVLQLERRGRMAVEDEALLVNSLLPLLALLSSSSSDTTNRKEVQCAHTRTKQTSNTVLTGDGAMMEHNADEGKEGDDAQGRGGDAPTWRQWTDLAMLHDLLLLVASGMLALPWSREGIYLTVHRHSTLCRLYGSRAGHTASSSTVSTQPSVFAAAASSAERARVSVMDVLRWFSLESTPTVRDAAAHPEGGTTGGSSGATTASYRSAGAAMWTLAAPVGSHPHSPTSPTHLSQRPHRDFDGPAALTRVCERIDAMCRQQHPLFHSAPHTTGGDATATTTTAVAPSTSRGIADEGKAVANDSKREGELTDDAMERHLDAALRRHAHLMLTRTQCSAASGLLIVVAAYRSLSRALFSLRDAWEDQIRRMRDDDDGGGFAFRTATYCTSHDVTLFRWTLRVVHRCVFALQLQPAGLLRLWLGYLQHLFLCVVPPSASRLRDTSQSGGGGDEDTLRLMPISWQRSRRVSTLFGGRVHRTGWRALQHEVEPSSHTRLREELGTCLAELFVMPFETHDEKEEEEDDDEDEEEGEKADAEASRRAARTSSLLQRTLPHLLLEMLCELLSISLSPPDTESGQSTSNAPAGLSAGPSAEQAMAAAETQRMEAQGRAVEESCLGLAGLLAFLRRLELLVVPGSLQDQRLLFMLRRVYAAADAAAMGV